MKRVWGKLNIHTSVANVRSDLRTQGTADARMRQMEAQVNAHITGMRPGRHNLKGECEPNPIMRWPNENLPIGENGCCLAYDELCQFVSNMITTIMDVSSETMRNAMYYELKEVMDTCTSSGWIITRAIFADMMTKLEQGGCSGLTMAHCGTSGWMPKLILSWDPGGRSRHHLNPPPPKQKSHNGNQRRGNNTYQGPWRELPCFNYNRTFCKESKDHDDPKLPQRYIHVWVLSFNG